MVKNKKSTETSWESKIVTVKWTGKLSPEESDAIDKGFAIATTGPAFLPGYFKGIVPYFPDQLDNAISSFQHNEARVLSCTEFITIYTGESKISESVSRFSFQTNGKDYENEENPSEDDCIGGLLGELEANKSANGSFVRLRLLVEHPEVKLYFTELGKYLGLTNDPDAVPNEDSTILEGTRIPVGEFDDLVLAWVNRSGIPSQNKFEFLNQRDFHYSTKEFDRILRSALGRGIITKGPGKHGRYKPVPN